MRRMGAAAAAALIACQVHGGPAPDAWDPFDAGEGAPPVVEDPTVDAGFHGFGPDVVEPTTDAGCPATKPREGTACVMWTGAGMQVCPYVVHGGSRTCTCERLTPESDDLWQCRQRQWK